MSKTAVDCGVNSSLKDASRPLHEETTLHNKIDLLMGLVQDVAPVVKTLQAHQASLLYGEDEPVMVANTRLMNLLINDPNWTWVHSPVLPRQGNQQLPLTVR